MTNIVLNVSRQTEWIDAFSRCQKELGWHPAYWITYEQNHDAVGAKFPRALRHRRLDLNRGIVPVDLKPFSAPLDEPLLLTARPYLVTALEVLDRFDLGLSMSHGERVRIIHSLLAYWLGVIDSLPIDMGVFSAPPHGLGNYLLYAALKIRNKPTRIFVWTPINNLTYVGDDIEHYPDRMVASYQSKLAAMDPIHLTQEVSQSIQTIRDAEPTYQPWYVGEAAAREDKRREFLEQLEGSIDAISSTPQFNPSQPVSLHGKPLRRRRGEKGANIVERTFKVPGRPLNGDKMISLQEYEDYRDWAMVQKIRLRKAYEAICTPADTLNKPFVYFGLHYQPERTTCPDGGVFSDQFLCASLLSRGVPAGWEVVVKEHPNQFRYTGMGETGRWNGYYDEFLSLPNLRFVSTDMPSIELINRSSAVATVTGAVGWEALVRGKPLLHFGFAWYGLCRGAYRITCVEDVQRVVANIAECAASERDVTAFASVLEHFGKPAITTPTMRGAMGDTEPLASNLFDLLVAST